jgi:Phage tail sheath protein.
MADFFTAGERKIRPGVHQRYLADDEIKSPSGARDGYCAIAIRATWGPLGEITEHTGVSSVLKMYGKDDYSSSSTVKAAIKMFEGGAKTLRIFRMGTGGMRGTYEIKNGAQTILNAIAKHEGDKDIKLSIAPKLGDTKNKVLSIYETDTEVESFIFACDASDETHNLMKAAARSEYIVFEKIGDGVVPNVSVAEGVLAGGQNPTVTNESYSKAWEALDRFYYNTIALDIDDDENLTLSKMLHDYIALSYSTGKQSIGVVGEKTDVAYVQRLENAESFNDAKIVYFGDAYQLANGDREEGVFAICKVAGLIAATPSSEGITHKQLPGAVKLLEQRTNSQYEDAIRRGMLLLSASADGVIWFDSGINTLTTLGEGQDEGWKKIRRVKTRFEAMDRIDRAIAVKIGRINANTDGIAEVIQTGQGILNDMATMEGKLYPGSQFMLDEKSPPTSDSAWFVIEAIDIDSLEHIYLGYLFRFQNI